MSSYYYILFWSIFQQILELPLCFVSSYVWKAFYIINFYLCRHKFWQSGHYNWCVAVRVIVWWWLSIVHSLILCSLCLSIHICEIYLPYIREPLESHIVKCKFENFQPHRTWKRSQMENPPLCFKAYLYTADLHKTCISYTAKT